MNDRKHRAKFSRLKNGAWGVRVTGPTPGQYAGREVPVTKRSGEEVTMKLSKLLWSGDSKFGPAALYSVSRKKATASEKAAPMSRDEAEYQSGKAEVEQIQAISAPNSELREALYMEMETRDYNLGLSG